MEELIRCFEGQLLYYLRRMAGNEADAWNLLQETWLKVIGSIKNLREPKSLAAWLYAIARRTAMSHLRSKYAKDIPTDCTVEIVEIEDKAQNVSFETAEEVHKGLGRISLAHREVLTLFFLEDLSLEQIGTVLEIPVGTVKSRVHYAKLALKKALAREGNGDA